MAGGPWAKVFAKLNARREGTGCSPANQLHLQAVFINYDREARRQLVGGGEGRGGLRLLHWKNVQNVLALGGLAK